MRLAKHTVREGDVVEVWDGDTMVAAIYSVDRGIRIFSKYGSLLPANDADPFALEIRFGKMELP
jgi:hypothetical protein